MTKRPRATLNVPDDVYRWFLKQETDHTTTKTRLHVASLMALRMLSEPERKRLIQFAKLIDEGAATWTDFEHDADLSARDFGKSLSERMARAIEEQIANAPPRTLKQGAGG